MVRGQPLSNDVRKVILHMAKHLDMASIQHYTGCALRTIQQVLANYRRTGTTLRALLEYDRHGKQKSIATRDVRVSYHQNQPYLRVCD
jgi:hypothetical protein